MAKSNIPEKIILGIFVLVLLFLIGDLVRRYKSGIQINIIVPYGLIAIFISFYLFRDYNRARKEKRENRRDYLNERRQEILDNIFKKNRESGQKED